MAVNTENENQYEVSFCVRHEETNVCPRHSMVDGHGQEAYTVMSGGSSPGSEPPTSTYSLAVDAMPGEPTSVRSYTVSGRLTSATAGSTDQENSRPYYSTVIPKSGNTLSHNQARSDLYSLAGDVVQPSRNSRVNGEVSIPEIPSRSMLNNSKLYSTIRHKNSGNFVLMAIAAFALLVSIFALSLGIVLLAQIVEIRNKALSTQPIQYDNGVTSAPPTDDTHFVYIDECSSGENHCHPEGGVCVDIKNGYGCFCKDGWRGNGQNCTEITYPSCASLRKIVGYNTGYYEISPDPGNVRQFTVKCVMQQDKGITEIGHNSESTMIVSGCDQPGCYKRDITYAASMEQIVAVIKASSRCSQYIKYNCYHAALAYNGVTNGWWVSRIGTNETRWADGVDENSCTCSKVAANTTSCPGCNCNANDSKYRSDEGYISNKTLLPIIQLRFGDVGDSWEEAHHTLGKLRCFD